jgi:hypothetical protein
LANACDADWRRQNRDPGAKPPGLEDGLFTGDDLRAEPSAFDIEETQSEKDGSFRVYVRLKREDPPEDTDIWRVAAILVRENGRFAVDDVIWLRDNPQDVEVRLSEYLTGGCDGSHWVDYADSGYPNEVPGYRFYSSVTRDRLESLVSTMSDVRQALGNPDEANDVSAYTEPYPGDEKTLKPVFKYKFRDDWQVLVYFAKYCFHEVPEGTPADNLCSLDLVPLKPIAFDVSKLPSTFVKTHIQAVDAEWDEYSDGTGLQYEVYTTHSQYGSEKPGDLSRISYGPPRKGPSAQ